MNKPTFVLQQGRNQWKKKDIYIFAVFRYVKVKKLQA